MPSIVIEFLLGLYLGLLTGIVPAIVAGGLGFAFKYITGVTLPGLGVVVLAVAIAGVNGGLLGLIDPSITSSPRLMVALVVIMMLSLYAHAQGDKLGSTLPRRFSLRELGTRTLSGDVIFNVGGIGHVEITPVGEVKDIEGYPPLSSELRTELARSTWEFSADLPIEELERRLESRLRSEYDFTEIDVEIDSEGRARIAAAPPLGSLSRRVPEGQRAVSISALIPTGIARGERVELHFADRVIEGTVLSAESDPAEPSSIRTDGGAETVVVPEASTAPQTTGGEGRITVTVPVEAARYVVQQSRARVVVLPRGLGLEFTAVQQLREAGNRFRRLEATAAVEQLTIEALELATAATVLAIKQQSRTSDGSRDWSIHPDDAVTFQLGDEFIVMGPEAAIAEVEALIT